MIKIVDLPERIFKNCQQLIITMTCCKFSTGCYLNCDFSSCKRWCQKLEQYKSKICGVREMFGGRRTLKKHQLNVSRQSSKKEAANILSRTGLSNARNNRISKKNNVAEDNIIDVVNNEEPEVDDFCECNFHEVPSFLSVEHSDPALEVDKKQKTCSMVDILRDLHQQCFSEKQDGKCYCESENCNKADYKKPRSGGETKYPSNMHEIQKNCSAQDAKATESKDKNCWKQHSIPEISCGRQISMSAVIDKIKEGVACILPEDTSKQRDYQEISSDKQKQAGKCKLENLKGGGSVEKESESKKASTNANDEKSGYLLDKLTYWRNSIAEVHQKLQQVIPKVCVMFDKTNQTLVVKPGKSCEKDIEQCKKDE